MAVLAEQPPSNHATTSVYDQRGKLTADQDPLGVFMTYQYDPAGNRVLRLDGRGWPTTYAFDNLNRETGRLYIGRPCKIKDYALH